MKKNILIVLAIAMLFCSCRKNDLKQNGRNTSTQEMLPTADVGSGIVKTDYKYSVDFANGVYGYQVELIREDASTGKKEVIAVDSNCVSYKQDERRCIIELLGSPCKIKLYDLTDGSVVDLCEAQYKMSFISDDMSFIYKIDDYYAPYSFSVYDVNKKETVLHEDLRSLAKNICIFSDSIGETIMEVDGNLISIFYFDGWGELFEEFIFDTDSFSINRKDINYSKFVEKDDLDKIEQLKEELPALM